MTMMPVIIVVVMVTRLQAAVVMAQQVQEEALQPQEADLQSGVPGLEGSANQTRAMEGRHRPLSHSVHTPRPPQAHCQPPTIKIKAVLVILQIPRLLASSTLIQMGNHLPQTCSQLSIQFKLQLPRVIQLLNLRLRTWQIAQGFQALSFIKLT